MNILFFYTRYWYDTIWYIAIAFSFYRTTFTYKHGNTLSLCSFWHFARDIWPVCSEICTNVAILELIGVIGGERSQSGANGGWRGRCALENHNLYEINSLFFVHYEGILLNLPTNLYKIVFHHHGRITLISRRNSIRVKRIIINSNGSNWYIQMEDSFGELFWECPAVKFYCSWPSQ